MHCIMIDGIKILNDLNQKRSMKTERVSPKLNQFAKTKFCVDSMKMINYEFLIEFRIA